MVGQLSRSAGAYRRALELEPYWDPARELEQLTGNAEIISDVDAYPPVNTHSGATGQLAPELAPHKPNALRRIFVDSVHIRRRGRSPWGVLPTLRGVQGGPCEP
jgi:hypothetical protein